MFYVDLPTLSLVNENDDGTWECAEVFKTKEEAVAFTKKYFSSDDEGNVCLISGSNTEDDREQ